MASRRVAPLDGLRGVAALVVVVHHSLLVAPSLADGYGDAPAAANSAAWWLVDTPLHIVWAGGEAVWVFFVLSGLVLALPAVGGGAIDWRSYYPRRAARLYLPVWGALLCAALVGVLVHRQGDPQMSWWFNAQSVPLRAGQTLRDGTLFFKTGTAVPVLWSLRWEVLFSAALPLFVVFGRVTKRWTFALPAVGLVAAQVWGVWAAQEALIYLPAFAFGTLIAFRMSRVQRWGDRIARRGRAGGALFVLAVLLLTARWTATAVLTSAQARTTWLPYCSVIGVALGATLLVVLAIGWAPLARALEQPAVRWLGSRSFSLYLVHVPIVLAVASVIEGWTVAGMLLTIALSLAVGDVFYRAVERPSIELARRLGRLAASRGGAADRPGVPSPVPD